MGARRFGALVLAASLVTGMAACGGDDDEGSDAVNFEDVEDDASASASGTEDEESDDSGDDVDEEAVADVFGEGCAEFLTVFSALGGAIGGAFDAEAAEQFEQFVDDAPEEIRDDLETVAAGYGEFAEALEDAGFDPEDPSSFDPSNVEAFEVFAEAGEALQSSEFQEANENISTFIDENCQG